jgi:hypothetical protein
MPQITDAEYKAGFKIIGADVVDPGGKVVRSDNNATNVSAPATTAAPPVQNQQSAVNLPIVAQSNEDSPLANLKLALRDALNEGGRRRLEEGIKQISPISEGLPPGSMGQVVDMIRNSVATPIESIYKTSVDAIEEEARLKAEKQKNALDIIKQMADDGSLGDLPDEAILAMSKSSGLDAGQLLSWRVSIKRDKDLGLEKARKEIELLNAQIGATGRSNRGSGAPGAAGTDVDSYAEAIMNGSVKITGVPQKIRAQVLAKVEELKRNASSRYGNETQARADYDREVASALQKIKAGGDGIPLPSQVIDYLNNNYGKFISSQEIEGTVQGMFGVGKPATQQKKQGPVMFMPGVNLPGANTGIKGVQAYNPDDVIKGIGNMFA